jgi:hypothetical protein
MNGKCITQCEGCDHKKDDFCEVFFSPEAKFRVGRGVSCGMATHLVIQIKDENGKVRIGQQKQKKVVKI